MNAKCLNDCADISIKWWTLVCLPGFNEYNELDQLDQFLNDQYSTPKVSLPLECCGIHPREPKSSIQDSRTQYLWCSVYLFFLIRTVRAATKHCSIKQKAGRVGKSGKLFLCATLKVSGGAGGRWVKFRRSSVTALPSVPVAKLLTGELLLDCLQAAAWRWYEDGTKGWE